MVLSSLRNTDIYASTLAQIEIASCFRNDQELLFQLLSPIIYEIPNL